MLLYENVLPTLIRICETYGQLLNTARTIVVVRDLLGKVRLAIDIDAGPVDLQDLASKLAASLDGWFSGPIVSPSIDNNALRRAARGILDGASDWPDDWPATWEDSPGALKPISTGKWRAYRRVLGKESWLEEGGASSPWPLIPQAPAIISFYSFKGGVGRTSALAVVARQLARRGKKVLCIDLDLEAPGLDSILDFAVDRGVIDYLLAHAATGTADTHGLVTDIDTQPLLYPGGWLKAIAAGTLVNDSAPASYIEKLSRLDYLGHDNKPSPVQSALEGLVKRLKREHSPDYIFVDSRAGLHDLGGLSLTSLAHVDVIVTRADRQGLQGLRLVLDGIRRRRKPAERRICIVHNFARLPIGPGSPNADEEERFRQRVHETFVSAQLYNDEPPSDADATAAHYPIVVGAYDEILRAEKLSSLSDAVLENDPFRRLRRRIEELATREVTGDQSA